MAGFIKIPLVRRVAYRVGMKFILSPWRQWFQLNHYQSNADKPVLSKPIEGEPAIEARRILFSTNHAGSPKLDIDPGE
jgi:hypothetical protein